MLAVAAASLWLGRWNGTCWALALSYFVVQAWWLLNSGAPLYPGDLFMVDLVTVLLVYCKTIARDKECEFETGWDHLKCFLMAPTPRDRIVLAIFPLMWAAYVLRIDETTRWWALYWLSMLQFLIAGSEAIDTRRKAKAPRTDPDIPSSGLMKVAWAGERRSYG